MKEEKTKVKKEVPAEVRAEIETAMRKAAKICYAIDDKTDMTRLTRYRELFDEVAEMDRIEDYRFNSGKGLTEEQRMEYMETLTPFKLSMEILRRLISVETVRLHRCVFARIWQVLDDGREPDAEKIMAVLDDILSADKLRDEEINNPEKNIYAAAYGM